MKLEDSVKFVLQCFSEMKIGEVLFQNYIHLKLQIWQRF